MSQKQQQQPIRYPAGLHIESGWSDKERQEYLEKVRKEQAQDRRNG